MTRAWVLAARCSLRGLTVAAVLGLAIVGGAMRTQLTTGVQLGLILAGTLVFFAVHSAWRMAKGLEAFAAAVPADPTVEASPSGEAELSWPSFGLVVRGEAAILREPDLEARAGGQPLQAPVDEGDDLAEEALQSLGIEPG